MNNLQVVYDMSMNPSSYDFLPFLAAAEKHRINRMLSGIDVHFMPGEQERFYEKYWPKGESEREGLLWRVCVASCRLLKSVRSVHVYSKRSAVGGDFFYPESWAPSRPDISHGRTYLRGALRCFSASDHAKKWVTAKYGRYMTITLRECNYGEDRNSNRVEWWKVARAVRDDLGGKVVIVPDTFGTPLKDFPSCIEAAWDLDIRCALYEGAVLNMGVENGPMVLAMLSKSPFIMSHTDLNLDGLSDGSRTVVNMSANSLVELVVPYWKAAA